MPPLRLLPLRFPPLHPRLHICPSKYISPPTPRLTSSLPPPHLSQPNPKSKPLHFLSATTTTPPPPLQIKTSRTYTTTTHKPPNMAVSSPQIKLNSGATMPALGFGTFASVGSPGETHRAVVAALKAGYRHLDCAWFYQNEDEVGTGIKEFLDANKDVKREDLFVCTKVWQHLHAPEDVEWSVNDSLKKLQLEYVDLYLIHWPFAAERTEDRSVKLGPDGKYIINKALTEDPTPTWRAMESLVTSGKAKSIGVSNYTIPGLKQLLSLAKIPPAVNQIEIHPFLPNQELIDFCRSVDVVPVAYSPLGSQDQVPGTGEKVATNKDLNAVAEKNGVSLAQVLIAWGIKRGYAVLPKSSNEGRIKSNAQLIKLSDEDFEAVNKVAASRHTRFVNMKDTFGYNVWPEEK